MKPFALALLFAAPLAAQEKLDAPRPTAAPVHRFWDRTTKIEFAATVGVCGFDAGQTWHNLSSGGHEYSLPTQNGPKAAAMIAGLAAGSVAFAWVLHRTGHHKLERIPMLYVTANSLAGIVTSKANHGAW